MNSSPTATPGLATTIPASQMRRLDSRREETTVSRIHLLCSFIFFLCFLGLPAHGFDLHKLGPQHIDGKFLAELEGHPKALRAVFLGTLTASTPLILYVQTSGLPKKNTLICRMQLPKGSAKTLNKLIGILPLKQFSVYTMGGKPFYRFGWCHSGTVTSRTGKDVTLQYVPFPTPLGSNSAFIGDLGFLTWKTPMPESPESLQEVILAPFQRDLVSIAPLVQWNRYYTFHSDFFGLVHRLEDPGLDLSDFSTWEPILHKLTANKGIKDHLEKKKADLKTFFSLLKNGNGLLSQRERARRQLFPDYVHLNWSRISETDIGTGHNQFVFMGLGSGINYFDDPWKSTPVNVPSPRLLFFPEILHLKDLQIYPTYSIEPKENGAKRLGEINRFQLQSDLSPHLILDMAVEMPLSERAKVVDTLMNGICCYGLLNDSAALTCGFFFQNLSFRGNIINNEVRLRDSLDPRCWLMAVIIPLNTKKQYLGQIETLKNDGLGPLLPRGKPWTEIFIEAPYATDIGFRMAYLEFVLRRSHPHLWRLCLLMRENGSSPRPGYPLFMNTLDRIIRKEGSAFFQTMSAQFFRNRYRAWQEAWCDFLEAYRGNQTQAICEELKKRSERARQALFTPEGEE